MAKVKTCKKQSGRAGGLNSALILALAGFVSKFLGALYRIPLTNILGAEGIGFYQLIFPIYSLVLVMSSGAIPTATARLVAERSALNDPQGSKDIFKVSAILLTVSGLFAASVLLFLSRPIAQLQGNIDIRAGYMAVAPAVLVVAISAAFKGWFQGNMNMRPSALTQIVEQVVKMAAGLLLAAALIPKGVMYAVTGALIGLTFAEVVSFISMAIIYLRENSKTTNLKMRRRLEFRTYATDIIKLSTPIFFSSIIFPVSNFTDSLLIVNLLEFSGVDYSRATAMYGILTGPVNSLINMPVIVALAVAITIIPVISKGRVYLDACGIKQKSSIALKTSYFVSIPCAIIFVVLARPIMSILYRSFTPEQLDLSVNLLRLTAINVVLLSQVQIYSSLLQALDKSKIPILSLAVGVGLKILLNFVLIPRIGIYGAAISTTACFLSAALINGIYFKYLLGTNKNLLVNVFKIIACSVIMGAVAMVADQFIPNRIISIIVALLAAAAVYLLSILMAGIYSEQELATLPGGEKLAALQRRFR